MRSQVGLAGMYVRVEVPEAEVASRWRGVALRRTGRSSVVSSSVLDALSVLRMAPTPIACTHPWTHGG